MRKWNDYSHHTVGQFRVDQHSTIQIPWTLTQEDLQIRMLKQKYKVPFIFQNSTNEIEIHFNFEGIRELIVQQSFNISTTNDSDEEYVFSIEETE